MTEHEKNVFLELTKQRASLADALDQPALSGVKTTVVDKYSDYAHFIYELLQNADDAGATSARFVLLKDRLIFAHNGTRHFTVSNVQSEKEDTENGNLGDINAITSIANSNKTASSIGKFGVGFKAVFQYTETPEVYDTAYSFKIDRFIVPILLEKDHPYRQEGETLFVFPFNHPSMSAEQAYYDISNKLRALNNPILFLSNLRYISFEIDNVIGLYEKTGHYYGTIDNIRVDDISLSRNIGEDIIEQHLWLLSRTDENGRIYSVGYYYDDTGELVPVTQPAFCFFPTKEVTNLKFIIHAPFLLTDSREGIKASEKHNKTMIKLLAKLAADGLIVLRDIGIQSDVKIIGERILNVVPAYRSLFAQNSEFDRISFLPFYDEIKRVFKTEEIIPAKVGYVSSLNAYWATVLPIADLLSDEQLALIVDNANAKWAFPSFGHDNVLDTNPELEKYICDITRTVITEDAVIQGRKEQLYNRSASYEISEVRGITASFIENQEYKWLHRFYKWLSETANRTHKILYKPVFLNQNRKAVAAYDEEDTAILFLPTIGNSNYNTVNRNLLANENTLDFIKNKVGIKEPSLKDEIYNKIIPLYETDDDLDCETHFIKFFNYYIQCPQSDLDHFISELKELQFLYCTSAADDIQYRGRGSEVYLPSEDLRAYFSLVPDTLFLEYDYYRDLIQPNDENMLISFFKDLNVADSPRVLVNQYDMSDALRLGLPFPNQYSHAPCWRINTIDGCIENITRIAESKDLIRSQIVWRQLAVLLADKSIYTARYFLYAECKFFYYTSKSIRFPNPVEESLKTFAWLMDSNNEFKAPSQITATELSYNYDLTQPGAENLIAILDVLSEDDADNISSDKYEGVPEEYISKLELMEEAEQAGISEEELRDAIAKLRENKKKEQLLQSLSHAQTADQNNSKGIETDNPPLPVDESDDIAQDPNPETDGLLNKARRRVVKDIVNRVNDVTRKQSSQEDPDDAADEDEMTPKSVDFSKKIDKEIERNAATLQRISYEQALYDQASTAEKYSYAWFRALLELEALNSKETQSDSREVSITFSKVERERDTARTLVLKHSNKNIPQFMEDLADIPLVLKTPTETKSTAIEVVNIKSYDLRVKLKTNAELEGFDLSKVTEARIDAKSPDFLLEELKSAFDELELEDDYNLRDNLCDNISFIFGPPGTGKTTYLANNVLIPFMKEDIHAKVLVLTPTNKAADVIINRIIQMMGSDTSYRDWLVRFGGSTDEGIEKEGVFKDKTFDIRSLKSCVTVTTIARFPYDYFMPGKERLYLRKLKWDYIIIDEASMISLANIIYPLYKKTPKKFIIAGDPFQIQPITAVDLWKDENIYTMVELNSFAKPKTLPHDYHVELLTTQYRSIPPVGKVFSELTYNGILNHHRKSDSRRKLNISGKLDVRPLNIIKYPVSNYESIYKPKRLNGKSNYQIYSAILTRETVSYLASSISSANKDQFFRIGVIMAYKAQADLVEKMLASSILPDNVDVQVGTIHGFQGDECDIIFAVFNPPPGMSRSSEMFLNKINIINVSISRARDYLFIVMPDDNTEKVSNLRLVKKVEKLIKDSGDYAEYQAYEIEDLIFNNSNYIEENSFTTGHQNVNVYGLPEMKYEIRSEDKAVDIQIHDPVHSVNTVRSNTRVYNSKHGEGEIVSRRRKGNVSYITVRYKSTEIEYNEKMAFSGILKRVKN